MLEPVGSAVTPRARDTLASTGSVPEGGAVPLERPGPGMPGWRIGRYLAIERLGGGSQGQVWRSIELEPIFRPVALKLVPAEFASDPERVERLKKEAKRGGGLSHPGILPVYDCGSCDGYVYLAMQLVEGFPLSDLLKRRRAWLAGEAPTDLHRLAILPEADYIRGLVGVLARVARALECAHAHNIVHRDVKPSNILMDREHEDRVFLSDFGLARDLDDLTTSRPGDWAGTLPYMSPEKLQGRPSIDEKRSDIYALGVTLFEAVTLARPIELPRGLSSPAAIARLSQTEPRRPRKLRPRIPRDLEAVILMAIDRNPALRYARVGELADDLDSFLQGQPVRARPPGWWRRAYRRLVPHRVAIAALGVVVLLATTALVVRNALSAGQAWRAGEYRRLAERRLHAGRLEEAEELAARAESLDPGDSATAALIALLRAERHDALADEIELGDVERAWRDWLKLKTEDPEAGRALAQEIGFQPLPVGSDRPGTRVTFHALRHDGLPKKGPPLYETNAGSLQQPTRLEEMIPGTYWVTAYVDATGAFVERTFEVKRDFQPGGPRPFLRLHPRTTPEAASGMVEIRGGQLMMGSSQIHRKADGSMDLSPEYPRHPVDVPTFYLATTEVTNRDFDAFLAQTGLEYWRAQVWPKTGKPDPDKLDWPVTRVTHAEAVEYAAWRGCSLPEESQLEWAARGTSGRERPSAAPEGATSEVLVGLHPVNSDSLDQLITPSGTLLGLYGNAGEQTLLRYRHYSTPFRVRFDASERLGFVVRSGWFRDSRDASAVLLGYIKRAALLPDSRDPYVGFRLARFTEPRIKFSHSPLSPIME